MSSGEAVAIRDYVHGSQVPLIISNAGAQALTRDPNRRSPFIFRVSFANGQYERLLLPWCKQHLGFSSTIIVAPDYAAGHEKADAVKAAFEHAGGKVLDAIFPPLDTVDYGPFLQRILEINPDCVWAFFTGGTDSIRFVTQYQDFGLKSRVPLTGDGSLVDELILPEQGDAAVGIYHSHNYSPQYRSPENTNFVSVFSQRYGFVPSQFSYQGYLTGRVLVESLNAVNGQVEDKEALLNAIRSVTFVGPMGRFRFHPESQGPIIKALILRVTKDSQGTLVDEVLDEFDNVDDISW